MPKKKAADILADAQEQYSALVEEHNIMQEAYQQAEITVPMQMKKQNVSLPMPESKQMRWGSGAIYYTTDMMDMAEKVIAKAYESTLNNSKALETALSGYLEIIRKNKAELLQANEPQPETESQQPQGRALRRRL